MHLPTYRKRKDIQRHNQVHLPGYVSVYLFFFCMLASACGNFKGQKWKHTRMYDKKKKRTLYTEWGRPPNHQQATGQPVLGVLKQIGDNTPKTGWPVACWWLGGLPHSVYNVLFFFFSCPWAYRMGETTQPPAGHRPASFGGIKTDRRCTRQISVPMPFLC
jgi:hypothetical protein